MSVMHAYAFEKILILLLKNIIGVDFKLFDRISVRFGNRPSFSSKHYRKGGPLILFESQYSS